MYIFVIYMYLCHYCLFSMIRKRNIQVLLLCLLLSAMWTSCRSRSKPEETETERLYIYTEEYVQEDSTDYPRSTAVIDKAFDIPAGLSLMEKLQHLADTLSVNYFNGLEIQLLQIDSLEGKGKILTANLNEAREYDGPGSLPTYQSWYGFFQGSAGGGNTTVVLRESFLQPDYEGHWIDGIIFYYQGEKIKEFDHLNLQGLLHR